MTRRGFVLQEDLQQTMASMSAKLEKETQGHLEAKQQLQHLQMMVRMEIVSSSKRIKLQCLVCMSVCMVFIGF